MAITGDTRNFRNPQKTQIAWTAALWAAALLRNTTDSVAISLAGNYLSQHMEELLAFNRRFFYELDPNQLVRTQQDFTALRGYTKSELQKTLILQGNIFNSDHITMGDGGYCDWDITGTISEALSSGIEQAIRKAFEASGTRCLALTVSTRRMSKAATEILWKNLFTSLGSAWNDTRTYKFAEPLYYGRPRLGCGCMATYRTVIQNK